MKMQRIGLGTFRLKGEIATDSVLSGLELGYRHIDTAQIYDNEEDVGLALRKSGIARSEIFLTTKIWIENLSKDRLLPSLKESLQKLGTSYLDLTLIHWPSPNGEVPLEESLAALMEAKELGLTREIGVSNFPIAELKKAIAIVGAENIFTNQVEVHPFLQNKELLRFSAEQGIPVTAYMPLAYGKVVKDESVQVIAAKHSISSANVALSWLLDLGLSVIPSSTKRENLLNNLGVVTGLLDNEDRLRIEALESGDRLANPGFSPVWDR